MSSSEWIPSGPALLRGALAFGPVLVFLLALTWFDSHRLVRRRRVLGALLAGAGAAVLGYFINSLVLSWTGMSTLRFAVYLAPPIEEILKACFVVWFLRTGRAAFLVDAAILGFAVGAGFSVLENLYYLRLLPDAPMLVWIIRGFGTALMHGGCTSILAVLLRSRRGAGTPAPRGSGAGVMAVALLLAALLHMGFNRAMVQPIATTALTMVILPLVFLVVYRRGERILRHWIGTGFDRDQQLLELLRGGGVAATPLGRQLSALRESFPAPVVGDMLCLLRLHAEISIAVRGRMLLKQQGLAPARGDTAGLAERLEEAVWLEKSIGRTGRLALRPLGSGWDRRRWQRDFLRRQPGVRGSGPDRRGDDPA